MSSSLSSYYLYLYSYDPLRFILTNHLLPCHLLFQSSESPTPAMNYPLSLQSSTETHGLSAPRWKRVRHHLPSTATFGSTSKPGVTSPPLPPPDHLPGWTSPPLHYRLWIPIAFGSTGLDVAAVPVQSSSVAFPPPILVQDRREIHPCGDPLAVGASPGLAARYAPLTIFFCFSGDEHECGAVELITDPVSPRTQPSPTTTMPLLHDHATATSATDPTIWYIALNL
jgi:hypothetical protein